MPQKTSEYIEAEIIRLYKEGNSTCELSDKFNINRSTVQRILIRNNIELRKRTPCHYNIHFFDQYTVESCYWAGFIAADGYVRSDRNAVTIHLSILDIDHLYKLAKITNFNGNILSNNNDCSITFAGKWYVEALKNNFNIEPRKTFSINISNNIPKDMLLHFIRGYFDGDGSITHMNNYLHVSITSGSTELLHQITNYICENGIKIRNKYEKPKIYDVNKSINYFCNNAYKLIDLLYSNSTEETRLDRKYKLYLKDIPIFTQDRNYIDKHVMLEE